MRLAATVLGTFALTACGASGNPTGGPDGGADVGPDLRAITSRPPGVFLAGDMHLHSDHSDDASDNPMNEIVAVAEERGLDFFVVTDHDNHVNGMLTTWNDPDHHSDSMIMLYGVEWTTGLGHANFFGTAPFDHAPLWNLREGDGEAVAQAAHAQGLHFSANHPVNDDPWDYGFDIGLDGIEVWNALFALVAARNEMALALWDDLLAMGLRPTARGGSDCHHQTGIESLGLNVGNPTNWVYASASTAQALLEGLNAGHVSVGYAPTSERIELSADVDRDGGYETLMGDDVPANGAPIDFRIQIVGYRPGGDYEVTVIKNGAVFSTTTATSGTIDFTDTPPAGQRTYYRVEVRGETPEAPSGAVLLGFYGDFIGLTNPVYVGFSN